MTRKTLLALAAAALSATTAFTSAAEAGNGVRLGFGFPLGSFVAKPTPGYGGSSHAYAEKKNCKKPVARVARHEPSYTPEKKTVKHVSKSNTEVAETSSRSRPNRDSDSRRTKSAAVKVAKAETVETNSAVIAPVTGSTALVQTSGTQSTPATETQAVTETKTEEVATIIDTTAETTAPVTADPAGTAETAKTEEAKPEVKAEEQKPAKTASTGEGDCKKFIPIIGITVSVGCGK